MKKRVLSMLLVLVMVMTLFPVGASAAIGDTNITSQPKDVSVEVGASAIFTITANNSNSTSLKYIWFDADKVNTDDISWTNLTEVVDKIEAAKLGTEKTLTINNVTADMDGLHIRCAVYYTKLVPLDLTLSDTATLSVKKPACESHELGVNLLYTAAKPATCAQEGNKEYYYCTVCGRYYADASGGTEISSGDYIVPVLTVHDDIVHCDAVLGTCCAFGCGEHWECATCGKVFSDALGENEIALKDIETAKDAANHTDLTEYPAKAATCCEKGNIHYWYCSGCKDYFSDAEGKNEISRSDTELGKDSGNHTNFVAHPAQAATCSAPGNIRYWYCDGCGGYFTDAAGQNSIKESDTVIKQLDHSYVCVHADGTNAHYMQCSVCGSVKSGSTESCSSYLTAANCQSPATCSLCGFQYGEKDPENHANTELRNFVAPTTESTGYSGDVYCTDCGELVERGHITDKACAHNINHHEAADATCQAEGNIEYWECSECGVCWSDEALTTEIDKNDTATTKLEHFIVNGSVQIANIQVQEYGYDATGHWKMCKYCSYKFSDTYSTHTMKGSEPTCCSGDTCLICGYDDGARDAANHSGGTEVRGESDSYTGDTYCLGCEKMIEQGRVIAPACDKHTLELVEAVPRTCYEDGTLAYFKCSVCNRYYKDAEGTTELTEADIVDKCTGHDIHPALETLQLKDVISLAKNLNMDWTAIISGGISLESFISQIHIKDIDHCYDSEYHWLGCQRCGKTLADLRPELEAKGITLPEAWYELGQKTAHSGGTATCKDKAVCDKCGEKYGELGDHRYTKKTVAPTCTERGYTLYTCTVCGESHKADFVKATGHTFNKGNKCTVCGVYWPNVFYDVNDGDYFKIPVLWAYYHVPQVTAGVTENYFCPQDSCTRAQVVTFLWRMAGRPEPTASTAKFTDVQKGSYYYKAVLWAVENGITQGYSETEFGPGDTITRAQAVTFLWRYYGEPAPTSLKNDFTDVSENAYYFKAVLWAVELGITGGYGNGIFGPQDSCTRAQIVTFLYRFDLNT